MSPTSKSEMELVDEKHVVHRACEYHPLDDAARAHLWKLIHIWIRDVDLPVKPWATVFLNLALQLGDRMKGAPDAARMPLTVHITETGNPQRSALVPYPDENEQISVCVSDETMVLDGAILPLPQYWTITGSIRLQGVPKSKGPLVRTLLVVIVHVVGNLKLESHVLHDHHILVPTFLTTTAPPSPTDHETAPQQQQHSYWYPLYQSLISSPSSLKQWLLKKSIFKYIAGKSTSPVLLPSNYSSLSTSTVLSAVLRNKPPSSPTNRFEKLYRYIDAASVSSSPGAVFGVPNTIKRLYYEEKFNKLKNASHRAVTPKMLHRLSSKGSNKTACSAFTSSSSGPPETSRLGLEYLVLDTLALSTFIELQNIIFNYMRAPTADPYMPCTGPILCRINYYTTDRKSQFPDVSLGQFLRMLYDHRDSKCNSLHKATVPTQNTQGDDDGDVEDVPTMEEWCQYAMMDHCIRFEFTQRRVEVRMAMVEIRVPGNKIQMWTACAQCGATTPMVPMSTATEHYSLGKYLELQCTNDRLRLLPPTLCAHSQLSLSFPICHFQLAALRITMSPMPVQPYDLCPPRLQFVNPTPLASRGGGNRETVDRPSSFWKIELEKELEHYFTGISNHLDLIGQYIRGESSLLSPERLAAQLDELQRHVLGNYRDWTELVQETADVDLNALRRAFAAMSTSCLEQLRRWQVEHCPELIASCSYEGPEYAQSSPKIHAMPGAPVLVRQHEPSSIIAYTLSCRSYRLEIENAEDMMALNDTDTNKDLAVFRDIAEEPPLPEVKETGYYHSLFDRYMVVQGEMKLVSSRRIFIRCISDLPPAVNRPSGPEPATHVYRHRHPWFHPQHNHNHNHNDHSRPSLPTKWVSANVNSRDSVFRQEEGKNVWMKRVLTNTSDFSTPRQTKEVKLVSTFHPKVYQRERASTISGSKLTSDGTPHITHRFADSNAEFTCITYYANEFEELRKNCGVDKSIVESLSRCDPWLTTGGKSKSKFYKAKDGRFVVKEMLSSWNVDELEAFLDIVPAYLEYMKHTAETRTALTKIFGVYTLRMDVDGKMLWSMDVMVMEYLFYGRQITETFDFKGIRDRKAPESSSTLWDSDWIHGILRFDYGIVTEHSRQVTNASIRSDIMFLEQHNIMDYSLLVGFDNEKKEIAVGIVGLFVFQLGHPHFIGAYTWYKKIESKSKSTLKSQHRVTILPPDKYRERFYNEVSQYFVPIPSKFDRVQRPEPKKLPFTGLLQKQ